MDKRSIEKIGNQTLDVVDGVARLADLVAKAPSWADLGFGTEVVPQAVQNLSSDAIHAANAVKEAAQVVSEGVQTAGDCLQALETASNVLDAASGAAQFASAALF